MQSSVQLTPQRLTSPARTSAGAFAPVAADTFSPSLGTDAFSPSLGTDSLSSSLGRYYRIHAAFQQAVGRAPTSDELQALDSQLGPLPTETALQSAVAAYAPQTLDPVAVRTLTKQVMTPYFDAIARSLASDPVIQSLRYAPMLTPDAKLQLVERAKAVVGSVYQLAPIPTRLLEEAWEGGGYDFDTRSLAITRPMLESASAGDLLYLVTHELTHAFQDQLLDAPYTVAGPMGQLVEIWRANQPHAGYVSYDAQLGNFETYANQPLEFAAFLGGNVVEYGVTGSNSRTWGTALETPEMIAAIA